MAAKVAAVALLAAAGTACVGPWTAERVAADNSSARGGARAIEAVRAIDLQLEIHEGGLTLQGHYRANRDGCMRIDVNLDGLRVFTEALGSAASWHMSADDRVPLPNSEQGTAALRHGIEHPLRLYGLHEFVARGQRLELGQTVTLDGARYERVDAVYRDGYRAELYLDPRTHLVQRMREHKPMHVDVDPHAQRIETRFSDYRAVAGVLFPFRSEEFDLGSGKIASWSEVQQFQVNTTEALAVCTSAPPPV